MKTEKKCTHKRIKYFEGKDKVVCLDCGEDWNRHQPQSIYVNPPYQYQPVWVVPTYQTLPVIPFSQPTIWCGDTVSSLTGSSLTVAHSELDS